VAGRAQEIITRYFPEGYETDERLSPWRIGSGVVGTSNVLWITYTSSDPVFCRAAADAVINSYKEYYLGARTPPEMEDFFSGEMSDLQNEIAHLRERKTLLETESGIIDMKQQVKYSLDRLSRHQMNLDELHRDIAEKEEILRKLESFRDLDIDEQAALSNTLATEKLMDLRLSESELAVKYTGAHKELKQVRRQIEDLNFYLDKEIDSFTKVSGAELDLLKTKERSLKEQIASLEKEKGTFSEMDGDFHSINLALLRAEEQYDELSNQQMRAKLSKASNPEWNVTILSPAAPAYQKKARDYVRMALGPMFSLVVALGFAFFIDNLDHSVKNVAEAEETLGCQVLASFPDSEQ